VPAAGNLTDAVVRNAREAPEAVVFSRRVGGQWLDVTTDEFKKQVESTAQGLLAAGVAKGDRVALISRTRYEWTLFDYAIWWVGAVTVPIYETSSAEQIAWVLSDSSSVACVAETREHGSRIEKVRAELPQLQHVWIIEDDALGRLSEVGASVTGDTLEERRTAVVPEDLATLIYTSGTTGQPKGCMLTHRNFMFELAVAVKGLDELFETEGASTLLFLPLPHVFARIIQVGCVQMRARLGHSADVRNLVDDLAEFQPTFILAVPRVLEKVFTAASQQAQSEGKGNVFDRAATTAIDYSRALDRRRVGPLLRVRHRVFEGLVYRRVRASLGGRAMYAISGGAPLGERLAHFFRGIGVTVLEGYGLTETTGAVTVNTPDAVRVGTVGRPLDGTSVRVADDGELVIRGGQSFVGYWHDEKATSEAVDASGWLRTGDVGEIDEDGYVSIVGRKREILVTAGGKNVAPAGLEDVIRSHPLVSHCLVVGEARPFVAALVTLDRSAFDDWCARHGRKSSLRDLTTDADLIAEVQQAVDEANKTVSRAEQVRRFQILATDWTEESGHLTPTLKLKRRTVMRDFGEDVERLYR
jgi:long-chain acyl-CoA synthetase